MTLSRKNRAECQRIKVSRANLVAWIAAGLNSMKALPAGIAEHEVIDLDFWGDSPPFAEWKKLSDVAYLAVRLEKKEKEGKVEYRLLNGSKKKL